jgi:hypothetical protein
MVCPSSLTSSQLKRDKLKSRPAGVRRKSALAGAGALELRLAAQTSPIIIHWNPGIRHPNTDTSAHPVRRIMCQIQIPAQSSCSRHNL